MGSGEDVGEALGVAEAVGVGEEVNVGETVGVGEGLGVGEAVDAGEALVGWPNDAAEALFDWLSGVILTEPKSKHEVKRSEIPILRAKRTTISVLIACGERAQIVGAKPKRDAVF